MSRVLILGAKGNLGQELTRVFSEDGRYEVIAWDKDDVEVFDLEVAKQRITELRPELIVNAVAYNAVDACEGDDEEYRKAQQLNVDFPTMLADVARSLEARLVHYSTDYVFGVAGDAESAGGFSEDAEPQPMCRYAETKLSGEMMVRERWDRVYIIRLSKLFGRQGTSEFSKKSFFDTMLEVGWNQAEVKAVDGEKSCFTYAPDLARASRELVEDDASFGVYHLINEGVATWYDGVRELYQLAGISAKIIPVDSSEFPRPAKRPEYSALRNTKRPALRSWQEALAEWLRDSGN